MTMSVSDNNKNNELEYALRWLETNQPIVLATVIDTWGSSPRPVGSYMVINHAGNFMGSVSGGCVEGAVISEALEVINNGDARILEFSVATEDAWEVGLSCGGNIRVLLERYNSDNLLRQAVTLLTENRAFALITQLETGAQGLILDQTLTSDSLVLAADSLLAGSHNARIRGQSQVLTIEDQPYFLRCFRPTIRLYIIGAVHISQALAPMAELLGYEVTLIEPRELFAQDSRFFGHEVHHCWPDDLMSSDNIDAGTAVVTLTHDPKIDDIALQIALNSPAFYIGALGSKRTHAQRVGRLRENGFSDKQIARIHAPVGLNLGGRAPDEIALATLAQLVEARYA